MYSFLRSRRWAAGGLLIVAAVVTCCLLGRWQWHRAQTRNTPKVHNPLSLAAVPLGVALHGRTGLPYGAEAVHVTVTGTYDSAHQVIQPSQVLDGRTGSYVVTPLRPTQGRALLVLRGFVPGTPTSVPAAPRGTVTVTGWLVASQPFEAVPLPSGQVAEIGAAQLGNLVPYPLLDAYLGRMTSSPADPLTPPLAPAPPSAHIVWSVQSLAYTFEWYFFALAFIGAWVMAVRMEVRRRLEADADVEAAPTG